MKITFINEGFTIFAGMKAATCNSIFNQSIDDYHKEDSIDTAMKNPYQENTIEYLLYKKNWIDTVQWHLEDVIRDPSISPSYLVEIKRRIDRSNQDRTDTVEKMDDWFLNFFENMKPGENARMNSETPAWLLDRMSILALKVYHMREQTLRADASAEHKQKCEDKLAILLEQTSDMEKCFDELIEDIEKGVRYMKVYRQMKMYNDKSLNPVLYQKHST